MKKHPEESTPPRLSLVQRLRAYIPVEGQEGLAVRDALMQEAANEIERLSKEIRNTEKDWRAEMREAAAEALWKERQGEDYGSY